MFQLRVYGIAFLNGPYDTRNNIFSLPFRKVSFRENDRLGINF